MTTFTEKRRGKRGWAGQQYFSSVHQALGGNKMNSTGMQQSSRLCFKHITDSGCTLHTFYNNNFVSAYLLRTEILKKNPVKKSANFITFSVKCNKNSSRLESFKNKSVLKINNNHIRFLNDF